MRTYLRNFFIGLDQWINTWFWGYPDETISSRVGKAVHWHNKKGGWLLLSKFLNLFDKDHTLNNIEEDEGERRT